MTQHLLRLVWAGVMGLSLAVATTGAEPHEGAAGQDLTSAEMQADFDLMRHALEEAQPGLYRYSTKADMDRGFAAHRAKLSRPMSRPQFEVVVAETLALIRCGHTSMNPDEDFKTAAREARTCPLRVMSEGPKWTVLLNDTPADSTIQPGMELLEINGHPTADIARRFMQVLPADGDIETGKRHDITGRFATYYWWLFDQSSEFTIKARDEAGHPVVSKLAGVNDAERRSNHNPVNAPVLSAASKLTGWAKDNLSVRFFKDPEVAEIRLKYFVGNDFPRSVEDAFRLLREKGTRSLIIDLRGNGGGEDEYGAMVVGCLTDKPFRYFDHIGMKTISPSFKENLDWPADADERLRNGTTVDPAGGYLVTPELHHGIAEQQPGKFPFLGKVFVLTDGGTFSTAADFCAVTHHLRRATFIGEETGGGYHGNNSGPMPTLTLPHSKVSIRLPMYAYWNAVPGYSGKRRGTIPDYPVQTKVSDLLRGVDAPLDLAVKLAAQ